MRISNLGAIQWAIKVGGLGATVLLVSLTTASRAERDCHFGRFSGNRTYGSFYDFKDGSLTSVVRCDSTPPPFCQRRRK